MAKVVKSTREITDVEKEVKKVTSKNGKKKEEKKPSKDVKKKTSKKVEKKEKHEKTHFFKEVKSELAKVKWPNKKDMVKYSTATICFVIFFGIFFYLIEAVMALVKAWV